MTVLEDRRARWAPWINLLLPGGGLILAGAVWSGLLIGVLFAACANLALAAVLLFPDEFSRTVQTLVIGLAAGSYVGAQLRLSRQVRERRAQSAAALRRRLLGEAREHLARGERAQALAAIAPLAELARRDLLVAYRFAQVLTAVGDVQAARAAWEQVRTLDRHGIYRAQTRVHEQQLRPSAERTGGGGGGEASDH